MPERILVPLDGSPLAESVLPHVIALAQIQDTQVLLLQVLEPEPKAGRFQAVDPLEWHMIKAEAEIYIQGVQMRLQKAGAQVGSEIMEGRAAECIVESARRNNVTLLTLSSHGRSGISEWNVSSVVQKVILRACKSTLIVRAYSHMEHELAALNYRRVLVPLDGSRRAECVLPMAANLARHHRASLLFAHIVRKPEMPRQMPPSDKEIELADRIVELNKREAGRYLDRLYSRLSPEGLDVQTRLLVSERVSYSLHELVERENADLVILSAHGYSGVNKWPYGSIAVSFIAYGTTPLLIVQDLSPEELANTEAEIAARQYQGH